jgi:hypothetical protein
MTTTPAHHTQFSVRFAAETHRALYGEEPRRVEIGLMEMRGLEDAGAERAAEASLMIDGVPVTVGSLEDRVKAVR